MSELINRKIKKICMITRADIHDVISFFKLGDEPFKMSLSRTLISYEVDKEVFKCAINYARKKRKNN